MLNAECKRGIADNNLSAASARPEPQARRSAFSIHHSSFPRGISLLEVLISMGVLSVGLLGFAMLIPVGRLSIVEAGKADRTGACGRAALRELKVRRMLDYNQLVQFNTGSNTWTGINTANSDVPPFVVDPLGAAYEFNKPNPVPNVFANILQRCSLSYIGGNLLVAEQIFRWRDVKLFDLPGVDNAPGDLTQRPRCRFTYPTGCPIGLGNYPVYTDTSSTQWTGTPDYDPSYTWLLTVMPSAAEANLPLAQKTKFTVSVAVCYKRNLVDAQSGEQRRPDPQINNSSATITSGSLVLVPPVESLKANQWIMLYAVNTTSTPYLYALQWYRVVSVNIIFNSNTNQNEQWLTLAGADWDTVTYPSPTAVIITSGEGALGGVIGVYTTTIDLSREMVW